MIDPLLLADDGSVCSLFVGELSLDLGLLISRRSGLASSALPLKLASEESSGVTSCKVPANSGRMSGTAPSEYAVACSCLNEVDRGASGIFS